MSDEIDRLRVRLDEALGEAKMLRLSNVKLCQQVDFLDIELKYAEEQKDGYFEEAKSLRASVEAYSQKVERLENLSELWRNEDAETIAALRAEVKRLGGNGDL